MASSIENKKAAVFFVSENDVQKADTITKTNRVIS
jgi:hypothetical protein